MYGDMSGVPGEVNSSHYTARRTISAAIFILTTKVKYIMAHWNDIPKT